MPNEMAVMIDVERRLPLMAFDRLVHAIAPKDPSFAFRLVPRATLARRRRALAQVQSGSRLSAEEGSRVARLSAVWDFARDVWGSDDAARSFLFRPHMLLDGRRPIDVVLANEFGRPLVEVILGRLKYGTAA